MGAADRREILQNLTVLLVALSEAPLLLVQVRVEIVEHGHLLLQRDGHVVLNCVQCTKHQVEDANRMSGSK